jgi:DNA-dependent RNA polymerase auxiliary subunit epsilon
MSDPSRENTGVLYLNYSSNPKAPKWTGMATIGGNKYQVAAWEKKSLKNGEPILTINLSSKEE